MVLFGPLGLQSQLIGYLKSLAQRQNDLIGQVLHRDREKTGNEAEGTENKLGYERLTSGGKK